MPPKRKALSDTNVVYQVFRDEDCTTSWDTAWHENSEFDMLQGTYPTLAEANAAAERNLLKEWDRDFFPTYDVTRDAEGLVTVNAIALEGETFTVRVVKVETDATPLQDSTEVFIIAKTVFIDDDYTKPAGKEIIGVCQSMTGAGKAVEKYLEDKKEELPAGLKKKTKKDGSVVGVVKRGRKEVTIVNIEEWDVKT